MKLQKFTVDHYRSIEHLEINFPQNIPLILFGPNNSGKSNIIKAIECLLGEKYTSYIDFEDSDYYLRNKEKYPNISFKANFDGDIKSSYPTSSSICFTTKHKFIHYKTKETLIENTYHYENGEKMFLKSEEKGQCEFVLIDATRDMSRQFSYFSQHSMLSRMTKQMHGALTTKTKEELDKHFSDIKSTFEKIPKYKQFYDKLQNSFSNNIDGFEHRLEIDLAAYDPNNYFSSLRMIAKEGGYTRSFNEFGTGEQQILLMSFVKAYAETFKGNHFILGIEEPEAHLHPLAQRWLSKNIENLCKSDVQVIITTHSPEFLNIEGLEGFVKVYKKDGITKIVQHGSASFANECIKLGANSAKTNSKTILPFYKLNTFYDQLKGFFARKIILVEGPTELFSMPSYFRNCNYDLIRDGIEIIDCKGKDQIARNFRLFTAYGYECFCLFDADNSDEGKKRANEELGKIFGFDSTKMKSNSNLFIFDPKKPFGYFGKDYESYLRSNLDNYPKNEKDINGGKVLVAKIIAEENKDYKPLFIRDIAKYLGSVELSSEKKQNAVIGVGSDKKILETKPDDIPF